MDMKKWIEDIKNAPVKKAIPILSFPSVSLLNITVKELISDSGIQAKGMNMIADRVDSWASVSMMNLSVEAEAFGSEIVVSDIEVPAVVGSIVKNMDDAKALKIPKVGTARTGIYIEASRKACELIKDRPVFAGTIGPFSLAGRLMDVTETLIYCYTEPDMVNAVMEKTTAFLIDYIKEYKKAGSNGVVIAEPLTGILSPDLAAEFSSPYVKRIVDAVQDDNFIVIYHNCGNNTIKMIDSILSTGSSAYHFGNAISMKEMLGKVPGNIVVMGNVDPASQFRNGTPESVKEATLNLLSECATHPNFIISSGCDIPPASKWENIDAFFGAVSEFYTNKK
jgi:uroporphyrinogen decarboxylase